jgi:hypothetical protein
MSPDFQTLEEVNVNTFAGVFGVQFDDSSEGLEMVGLLEDRKSLDVHSPLQATHLEQI